MSLLKKFLCLIFAIFVGVVLFNFRTIPSGKLWDNYTVLYIPSEIEDSIVTSSFLENGIEEYVGLYNQRIPILLKKYSVEKTLFNLNIESSNNFNDWYLKSRLNYFFDSSKKYRLYYIPNQYKENVSSCIKTIEQKGASAGIDSNFSYPWFLPLVSILLFIFLFIFSKQKNVYLLGSFFPIFFLFCNPFYSCAISVFLLLVISFMISNVWKREGAVKRILHSRIFLILLICSVLLSLFNSIFSLLFLLLSVLASVCFIYIIKIIQCDIEAKETYRYVFIRNARLTSIFAGRIKTVCISTICCIFLIFGYFILNLTDSFSGHFASVLLPGQSSIASKELPSLEDFCKWNWDVITFPYKSINQKYDSMVVKFPHFVKEDGIINQVDQVFKYDDSFKSDVIQSLDSLDFYSIENVLKSQDINAVYGFTASSSYNVSLLSIIMMIITLFVLLFIYFSVIIKKGGRE